MNKNITKWYEVPYIQSINGEFLDGQKKTIVCAKSPAYAAKKVSKTQIQNGNVFHTYVLVDGIQSYWTDDED
jgi:hypothetical protein